jgi:hypothetical protein
MVLSLIWGLFGERQGKKCILVKNKFSTTTFLGLKAFVYNTRIEDASLVCALVMGFLVVRRWFLYLPVI